jgi:hypothetical protein
MNTEETRHQHGVKAEPQQLHKHDRLSKMECASR